MQMRLAYTAVAVVALGVVACGGPAPTAAPAKPLAPEWVLKGSGAFGAEGQKVFYGVGSASNIRNMSLLRTTSENRARNEISKTFETYSASLMKDYMASTSAGDPNKSSEEQHVEQAIKTFSANTLNGVQIVDHYQDPSTGELFSLARLDLASFTDNLGKMKELSAKVRDYVRQNAERVHMHGLGEGRSQAPSADQRRACARTQFQRALYCSRSDCLCERAATTDTCCGRGGAGVGGSRSRHPREDVRVGQRRADFLSRRRQNLRCRKCADAARRHVERHRAIGDARRAIERRKAGLSVDQSYVTQVQTFATGRGGAGCASRLVLVR